jgi:iron complex transport system permease protein
VPAAIACALLLRRTRVLDLMLLGDDVLASMGHRPRSIGIEIVALSAVAVGTCVAVCGAIGFVGLIAPVAARWLTRGHPGRALAPAGAIGAILLLLADLAVRSVALDHAIPVGVLTTLIGTPLFVAVLMSMRGRMTS